MIVSKDTNPDKDLYVLGAVLIDVLQNVESTSIDYISAFQATQKKQQVSQALFALTLDWLFLLGVIDVTESGDIQKCF